MAGDSTREPSLPANDDDGASTNSEATEDSEHDNLEQQKKAAAKDLYQKSIAQETRHLLRHQIWSNSYEKYGWQPFDPASYAPPKALLQDPHNYFYANLRRKQASDSPEIVLSHFGEVLLSFLRAAYGNQFHRSNPEKKVASFFEDVHENKFGRWLGDATWALNVLETGGSESAEARDMVISLGCVDAKKFDFADSEVIVFLKQLVEQLSTLKDYLEKQFEPTKNELAGLVTYGHITFDLLKYHYRVGETLATPGPGEKLIAFVVTKKSYIPTTAGPMFVLDGYGYHWNGDRYKAYSVERQVVGFEGTTDIKDLTCQKLTSAAKEALTERGKIYASCAGVHYRNYQGRRVIVDAKGAKNPSGYTRKPDEEIPECDSEKIHLLPPDMKGFNLAQKYWSSLFVEDLSLVICDENAWDHLVLEGDIKTLIRSLVKVTRNSTSGKALVQDVISGKGGGLIAVLHGPPGTGKTLTAEAVAEHLKRPLYMVGAQELSTDSPSSLESSLKTILSLATAWDAVLLIDEADVFLEKRSMHEIQRNALVSVALRVLEYHRGVLFLTTNRITSFDDAFLSRFSVAVKYPELNQSARISVWQRFLEMAGCNIHDSEGSLNQDDIVELAERPFNGRTVKNLVRTAQALALAAEEPLAIKHVWVVVRAQEKFLREFAA
ncbi:P-loop containing nucleoside triphosphate hydrolase protein [Stereum hirsutum FP-91666 SS1]|uniref:p-loop containing nucleoside triphosphate hydrolase protein n=1 Tax=Stereum hirsutum (strain FP-91666) TaxID=721885 RepID=R7RW16_STEHR|nr:P-loop containing nucleoside triphosphate hydrolase protein [Stereum hirsutum FP-91666 SS1]EIM79449.1 P-loop containing nucleoside triphosphate hydrolase protein [Stereum hirsutum FP-91666 SS1]